MVNTNFVTRFQQFWGRPSAARHHQAQTERRGLPVAADPLSPLALRVTPLDLQTPLTVLTAQGVLDRHTCAAFLACAADLYAQGCRRLLIDLCGVTRIELAGRFALHNIARLYCGEALLDLEDGWHALHRATSLVSAPLCDRVQVLASPALAAILQQADLCGNLAVYPDLAAAVAAYPCPLQ
jgi:hypothetical protein